VQVQTREKAGAARGFERDPPGSRAAPAQRHRVSADVDQGVRNARGPKESGGAVERVALRVAAEIELNDRVRARNPVAPHGEVGHARVRRDQPPDLQRVRHRAAGSVAVKTPQRHQRADCWVEEIIRSRGQLLRPPDKSRDFRGRGDVPLAASDRLIEGDQIARFPGVQLSMHAVELAEHAPHGGARARGVGVRHSDLRDRAEDVRARAVFVSPGASEPEQGQKGQDGSD
jgi:hypothetical protein